MEMKEKILQAAQELFFKYGIRSISMDDIAKHISISKKTIYLFYKDKDVIVDTLIQEKFKKDATQFEHIHKDSNNVVEEMFNIMKHMGKVIGEINPSMCYDLQKYHSQAWNLFKEFREERMIKMIEEMLVRGIRQGYIRPDINSKILARMRMAQVEMGFNPAIFPPDKFKILDAQLAMLEHFLYGICTLKGHKLINKYKQIIEEE
jgi:AcrR family transcriptional regulator